MKQLPDSFSGGKTARGGSGGVAPTRTIFRAYQGRISGLKHLVGISKNYQNATSKKHGKMTQEGCKRFGEQHTREKITRDGEG